MDLRRDPASPVVVRDGDLIRETDISDHERIFRTSKRCSPDTGECVEVAMYRGGVTVRDTAGSILDFGPAAWAAFLDSVKS